LKAGDSDSKYVADGCPPDAASRPAAAAIRLRPRSLESIGAPTASRIVGAI
jgi:hypothetical protein